LLVRPRAGGLDVGDPDLLALIMRSLAGLRGSGDGPVEKRRLVDLSVNEARLKNISAS